MPVLVSVKTLDSTEDDNEKETKLSEELEQVKNQ